MLEKSVSFKFWIKLEGYTSLKFDPKATEDY